MKRENYISWDQYFMGVALLSAMRSKDPQTQQRRVKLQARWQQWRLLTQNICYKTGSRLPLLQRTLLRTLRRASRCTSAPWRISRPTQAMRPVSGVRPTTRCTGS